MKNWPKKILFSTSIITETIIVIIIFTTAPNHIMENEILRVTFIISINMLINRNFENIDEEGEVRFKEKEPMEIFLVKRE